MSLETFLFENKNEKVMFKKTLDELKCFINDEQITFSCYQYENIIKTR